MEQVIGCILLADFITGLIHFLEDSYAVPFYKPFDDLVTHPNILHHSDPMHFTMGHVWHRNYPTFLLGAMALVIAYPLGFLTWQLALVVIVASLGNEIHAWSHKRPNNTLIRLLQEMKILISPEQHAKHHRKPYDKCYCTVTNWVNPILDGIRFWRFLEWCLALFGLHVKRGSEARGGY